MADMPIAAPAPEAAAPEAQGPGPLTQLAMNAHESMLALADAVSQSEGVPPQIQDKLGILVSQFEALVQEATGEGAPEAAPGMGQVPVEAGVKKVSPVL